MCLFLNTVQYTFFTNLQIVCVTRQWISWKRAWMCCQKNILDIVRSVSSVESPTFYQHLCGTRRNAPVIKQHTFIDPFIITSDGLNVENVRCALRRLRESRSWADQVIVLKPFDVVDGFWTGSHLKQKTARQWKFLVLKTKVWPKGADSSQFSGSNKMGYNAFISSLDVSKCSNFYL